MQYLTTQISKAFAALRTTKRYKTIRNTASYDKACAWFGSEAECYEAC